MINKISLKTIVIIVLVIAIIALFIFSLGQYNPTEISKPKEFKEDREEAKRKHGWYKVVVKNQKKLKAQLDKRFKVIYFGVRLGLILLWAGIMLGLYSLGLLVGIIGIITYTTGLAAFVGATYFLTSGTYYDLEDFTEEIKVKTENWVYGKYLDLEKKIERKQKEISQLEESPMIQPKDKL